MWKTKSGKVLTNADVEAIHDDIDRDINRPLKAFGICPFCEKRILLKDRKDFNSHSKIEVFHHVLQEHYQEYDKWADEHPTAKGFLPYTRTEFELENEDIKR